ncbi:hypothetical protein B484DRAFT_409083 [Ochromonadaceae sp. CCMP2298]|nr:hypothetical protein B484DRAFT_409083 [Ochromonadaceae sp. CCMP2298]
MGGGGYGAPLVHKVRHVWHSSWRDFDVPQAQDERDLLVVVDMAVGVLRQGGSVVVNCYSGRGRSGAFAVLVAARLQGVRSHSQLVDVVVRMRENRDGILETPQQFRFASRLLRLPSTARCGALCTARQWGQSEVVRLLLAACLGALLIIRCCSPCAH